jgi:predicted nucleic acid-binding protein
VNVVDSSGWLEYFADGKNARVFAPIIENTKALFVPSICLFEVFRRVAQQRGRDHALQAVAMMHQGHIVPLDERLALAAAELSLLERLPTADSIVLATARSERSVLWTQDADFDGKAGVKFFPAR